MTLRISAPALSMVVFAMALVPGCGNGADSTADPGLPDVVDIMDTTDLTITDEGTGKDLKTETDVATPPDPDGPPYVRHVNPFIGTGGDVANVGSAYPGAAAPLGLVKVSPDTTDKYGVPPQYMHCAGYWYPDDFLYGFSHTHLHGTGAADYGNILVVPTVGMTPDKTHKDTFWQPFSHAEEEASAGYYTVTITDPRVRAELTATTRCAHHRYTWLDAPAHGIVTLDPTSVLLNHEGPGGPRSQGGEVIIDPVSGAIEGRNWSRGGWAGRYGGYPVFFTARFNRAFTEHGTWLDGQLNPGNSTVETDTDGAVFGAWFQFDTDQDPVVEMQVCLSHVGVDGAKAALAAELTGWDFEGTRKATEAAWEKEMALFDVTGGTADDKALFYTAVYHVLQMPTIWTDVDGQYRGFDGEAHQADGWTYYTDMSLWDTFRTQHPLLALVWPDRNLDMMRSLVAMQKEGGWVPKWPMGMGYTGSMIGQHGATVIADAYLKGMTDFDIESIYASMKTTANEPGGNGNRDCFPDYPVKGYCVAGKQSGCVSKTLEYAFNDYCLGALAQALGKDEDAAAFLARSQSYKTLWDDDTQFFRPRVEDGSFIDPFDPLSWDSGEMYTEGSAWQWMWFAPHDEAGLRGLFGSDDAFIAKLTDFFELADENFDFLIPTSWYFHGNEPDMHAAFLFIRAGRPDLAQKWSRWILKMHYKTAWNGMVGNDDAGTLAAWYVFAAAGLFPWPCFPGYYVTSPLFDRVVIHLPGGDLTVNAPGAFSEGKVYIKEAKWNGEPLDGWWLSHEGIVNGGALDLVMADTPQ
ncbi:MAG: GH92 family glycosyl hydrolase [Deltaproteobacteria bacterium]|nr:GH92 family glycosyl hydrolase [Deltaproteobacteria bacterium]